MLWNGEKCPPQLPKAPSSNVLFCLTINPKTQRYLFHNYNRIRKLWDKLRPSTWKKTFFNFFSQQWIEYKSRCELLSVYPLIIAVLHHCAHLSLFSTSVTSSSTVSFASSVSELHTERLLITFSRRYPTIHWAPSVSTPNAVLRGMLIWGETGQKTSCLWLLCGKDVTKTNYSVQWNVCWQRRDMVIKAMQEEIFICVMLCRGMRGSNLLIELLVHQQVCLGPTSEEPHDVFPHLWAQKLRQAGSRCPGLNFWRPQHRWQQPVTGI